MLALLRKVFDFLFWWLIAVACIAFIGYFAWPLMLGQFYSLCSNTSQWKLCQGNWGSTTSADTVQKTIESKTTGFFDIGKTAVSDVLSDEGGKKQVIYKINDQTGVYMPAE